MHEFLRVIATRKRILSIYIYDILLSISKSRGNYLMLANFLDIIDME